jgi:hypothetical protein
VFVNELHPVIIIAVVANARANTVIFFEKIIGFFLL